VKAVLLREPGGPEQLEHTEIPEPAAEDGQVLVRVRAAGVNYADVLIRQGRYPSRRRCRRFWAPRSQARSTGGA
jgi:NADPH:quinone reductase-like Zn-dependent oxidoreductase